MKKILCVLSIALMVCSCNLFRGNNKAEAAEKKAPAYETLVGSKFLDFEVDGVKFSDYVGKGKVILVDFWASWCGPCRGEVPNIAKVYAKYAGERFDVLSVAVWDKPEDTKAAAEKLGISWDQIINAQRIPTDIYGIEYIPQILLFDADGTLLAHDLREGEIEKAVKKALGL
ncbi:MAG: TlpA family protein disulfide reductase [Bacteroidales bacterium]|nr:TlpA family protein disulfide reductase [Candidatus Cryptobacteroides aphodequi]